VLAGNWIVNDAGRDYTMTSAKSGGGPKRHKTFIIQHPA